jgi:opacity protein-like surface antigen
LNTDIGDTTAGGGIFVGYGKVLNNSKFYLGGEAYARYAHNVSNTSTTEDSLFEIDRTQPTPIDDISTGTVDLYSSVDVKSDWSYGAALKLGYLVTPKTMIYLLLGAEYSKFKVDVNHTGIEPFIITDPSLDLDMRDITDSYSYEENKVAFVPGIGIETMLTDKLSLKAEYTYADYGDLDTQHHDATYESSTTVDSTVYDTEVNVHSEDKVDLKRGLFSLGLAYHFNGI